MEMTLTATNTHYEHLEITDLTKLPGWISTDTTTRSRIINAAREYIIKKDVNPQEWFWKTGTWHWPVMGGFKALRLLLKEASGILAQLPREVWTKWVPVILDSPVTDDPEDHRILVWTAYQTVPEETIEWLIKVVNKQNEGDGSLFVLHKLDRVWDNRVAAALYERAKVPGLKPKAIRALLERLLGRNVTGARDLADSLIRSALQSDDETRPKAIASAKALLVHCQTGWSSVWPVMLRDPSFGRALFEHIACEFEHAPNLIADKLSEDQIADLYIWLIGQFPEDPKKDGVHSVSGRESVARLRDALVWRLRDRGTPAACEAIERLIHQFPSFPGLKWMLVEAKAAMRKATWQPPSPRELFKLTGHCELRLVRDGGDLLDLVMESLNRLKQKLQGETPAAEFLWDKVAGKKVYRPKDECALANFVKLHLENDLVSRGIIVNREVEVRRGEQTDIHVDAVIKSSRKTHDRVSAIIEIKGSWNRDLEAAIESQLVKRYLRENACQHGLYLIGWYNCEKWDDQDYRKEISQRLDQEKLQQDLGTRAKELSKGVLRVEVSVLNATLP